MKRIEVLFSPAEFEALKSRDLSQTTCVVFDILRATSSIITALANGALSVRPVSTIDEALGQKKENPSILLAGERDGFRITSKLTGSIDFDFANSPREFQNSNIAGKEIAMTTTNGTRALKACTGAREILVGSFLNLSTVTKYLRDGTIEDLLLVCSGTYEEASYEDLLGAGAVAHSLWDLFETGHVADSAQMARNAFISAERDLLGAMRYARNGRRLLAIPELAGDVPFCLKTDLFKVLAAMSPNGEVTARTSP